MEIRNSTFDKVDRRITRWMAKNGLFLLRISVAIIFIWYGVLKFFPGMSPAESLAARTIDILTFGLFSERQILVGLAILETVIGIGLLFRLYLREILLLLYLQMIGTMTPIFIFPGEVFGDLPMSLTLEGQYIFKNLVVISAGIVLGATVRGGSLISERESIK